MEEIINFFKRDYIPTSRRRKKITAGLKWPVPFGLGFASRCGHLRLYRRKKEKEICSRKQEKEKERETHLSGESRNPCALSACKSAKPPLLGVAVGGGTTRWCPRIHSWLRAVALRTARVLLCLSRHATSWSRDRGTNLTHRIKQTVLVESQSIGHLAKVGTRTMQQWQNVRRWCIRQHIISDL